MDNKITLLSKRFKRFKALIQSSWIAGLAFHWQNLGRLCLDGSLTEKDASDCQLYGLQL